MLSTRRGKWLFAIVRFNHTPLQPSMQIFILNGLTQIFGRTKRDTSEIYHRYSHRCKIRDLDVVDFWHSQSGIGSLIVYYTKVTIYTLTEHYGVGKSTEAMYHLLLFVGYLFGQGKEEMGNTTMIQLQFNENGIHICAIVMRFLENLMPTTWKLFSSYGYLRSRRLFNIIVRRDERFFLI